MAAGWKRWLQGGRDGCRVEEMAAGWKRWLQGGRDGCRVEEMTDLLGPRQLGYGVKDRAETAVHVAKN